MADRDISVRIKLTGQRQFAQAMQTVGRSMTTSTMFGNLLSSTIQTMARQLVSAFTGAVSNAASFEKALAAVQRRSGMTGTELEVFGQNIQNLSEKVPVTAEELLSIAENAAQLGIANKDLLAFTETMAGVGAVTSLSANDAATGFARIAKLLGTASDDYGRLGSVITDLGSSFATTETEILDMSVGLSQSAALYGLTESQVLALGTAMTSLGVQSAAGSGTVTRVLANLAGAVNGGGDSLKMWASAAGITAQAFKNLYEEQGAMAALSATLSGIKESGRDVTSTLGTMGITNSRDVRTLSALTAGYEVLDSALKQADTAWEENTALAKATGIEYKTTAAQISMLQNSMENLSTAVGAKALGVVGAAATTATEGIQELRQAVQGYGDLRGTLSDINATFEVQKQNIANTRAAADVYIDKLAEMGDISQLTAEEQAKAAQYIALLADMYPQMAGAFDASTGQITGGVDGLREIADAADEAARAQVAVSEAAEKVSAWKIINDQLTKEQALYEIVTAKVAGYEKQYQEAIDTINRLTSEGYVDVQGNYVSDDDSYLQQYEEARKIRDQMNADMQADSGSDYAASIKEMQELGAAIERDTQLEAEMSEAAQEAAAAAGTSAESIGAVQTQIELNAQSAAQYLADTVASYQNTLEEQYQNALSTVKGMISGFEGIDVPEPKNTKKVVKNLKEQQEYAEQYTEALTKAQELGLDGDALAELADGSEESFAVLQGLVQGGEEAVAAFEEQYAATNTAKENMAQAMAEATTEVQTAAANVEAAAQLAESAVTDMVNNSDQSTEAYEAAAKTVGQLTAGITAQIPELQAAVDRVNSLTAQLGTVSTPTGGTPSGGHAQGLSYVPYDGYVGLLHQGEMVLPRLQAQAYRAHGMAGIMPTSVSGNSYSSNRTNNDNRITNNWNITMSGSEDDVRELAVKIAAVIRNSKDRKGMRS